MPQAIRVIDELQELSDVEGPFVAGEFLQWDGEKFIGAAAGAGSGDVVGPGAATDNALARFDSTTGKLIQNSTATLSDGGDMTIGGGVRLADFGADGGLAVGFSAQPTTGIWRQDGAAMWFRYNGTDQLGISDVIRMQAAPRYFFGNTTGSGSAALGANSPAVTNSAPYTWITVQTSDGSTGYIPVWK